MPTRRWGSGYWDRFVERKQWELSVRNHQRLIELECTPMVVQEHHMEESATPRHSRYGTMPWKTKRSH